MEIMPITITRFIRIKEVEDGTNRLIRLCRPEIYDATITVDMHYEILVINNNDSSTKNN